MGKRPILQAGKATVFIMRKNAFPSKKNSIKTIIIFCFIVFALVIASLSIKLFFLIKESKFDGSNPFMLSLQDSKSHVQLLSFNPQEQTIHIADIAAKKPFAYVQKELGIIIDGQIILSEELLQKDVAAELLMLIFSLKKKYETVTYIDLTRLLLLAQTIPPTNIVREKITDFSQGEDLDKSIQELLQDSSLLQERKTIAIINATGITGFGRRLERLIVNTGGNVIAVTTAQETKNRSYITVFGEKSYTSNKLEKSLGLPISVKDENSLSDIIITLGKDSIETNLY